jgi:tRNA(Arg) A34 adenosine deaminase TadA
LPTLEDPDAKKSRSNTGSITRYRAGEFMRLIFVYTLSMLLLACAGQTATPEDRQQAELDQIYSLLAMAIVYKDWQTTKDRGHNIGAVLIDPAGNPVFWARNSRYVTRNSSQHGEVRLIRNYLNCSDRVQFLDAEQTGYPGGKPGAGFTLYTTLEPCVMCTGMMTMTRLWRAVYVQADPDYGGVMERLHHQGQDHGGHEPYPKHFPMIQVSLPEASALDSGYSYWSRDNGGITDYLRSEDARSVYKVAAERLRGFESTTGNQAAVSGAIQFLDTVVDEDYLANPQEDCPVLPW